ncbi:MAG: hypothetical protein H6719_11365 [Sandaracinaceae bacterium]|nr:hypothetical protein [Sandaracinaceae bacterium]
MGPIQAFRYARAFVRIVQDPTNLDEVFVLADISEESDQLREMIENLRSDPAVAEIFEAKPRLGPVDQAALGRLPEGTLGHAYASFMGARGLSHEDLKLVEGEKDMDWIRNHLRETHDLWHVLTGFDTDVAGELGLQTFYLAQLEGPLPVLLLAVGMMNTLFKGMDDARHRMREIARGWLLGTRAKSLFGLAFAERWDQPLEELRAEFALDLDGVEAALTASTPERVLAEAA